MTLKIIHRMYEEHTGAGIRTKIRHYKNILFHHAHRLNNVRGKKLDTGVA